MADASAMPSSPGMPNVLTPIAASGRPGATDSSRSRAARTPRARLARAPSSATASTVVEPSLVPDGSQTAVAIFVPPKSSPSTTGECIRDS